MTTAFRFSGEKLKAARLAAKLSQRQVGYKLDITNSSVLDWERNRSMPTADKLPAIAEILGVEIKDLFEEVSHEVQDED